MWHHNWLIFIAFFFFIYFLSEMIAEMLSSESLPCCTSSLSDPSIDQPQSAITMMQKLLEAFCIILQKMKQHAVGLYPEIIFL
jgi:hypothetical protein